MRNDSFIVATHLRRFIFYIVAGLMSLAINAHASTIHLLQANLYSWFTMDKRKATPPIVGMTTYINAHDFDFITTQENDYLLTDSEYKLNKNYKLAGQREDASIFYDSSRWIMVENTWKKIAISSDGGGSRVAVFAQFQNMENGNMLTVGTSHFCVAWGGHSDCKGGQMVAHQQDTKSIAEFLEQYSPNSPTLVTGDFNNLDDNLKQTQLIESIFGNYGLNAVKKEGNFIGPTFGSSIIDFVYFRRLQHQEPSLYTSAKGNPSDHAAIDVTFTTI